MKLKNSKYWEPVISSLCCQYLKIQSPVAKIAFVDIIGRHGLSSDQTPDVLCNIFEQWLGGLEVSTQCSKQEDFTQGMYFFAKLVFMYSARKGIHPLQKIKHFLKTFSTYPKAKIKKCSVSSDRTNPVFKLRLAKKFSFVAPIKKKFALTFRHN